MFEIGRENVQLKIKTVKSIRNRYLTNDSLLQTITKTGVYLKDTTHFISFIENTQISDHVVLATLDVSSLYTNL